MAPKGAPDSRLLVNLVKVEKAHETSFRTWTKDSSAANEALNSWAIADSGDAPDVVDASMRIYDLLARCNDSQRKYHDALSAYRTSLKDVLGREREIRTIARDREILVSRVLKLQRKRPSEEDPGWDVRMQDAQKELAACEACLRGELQALAGVKRRIFRDALSMRLQAFRELGRMFDSVASEALAKLEALGTPTATPSLEQFSRSTSPPPGVSPPFSVVSLSDSLAPSHSASQGSAEVDSSESSGEEYDENAIEEASAAAPSMEQTDSRDTARPASPPPLQRAGSSRIRPVSAVPLRASSPPPAQAARPMSYSGPPPQAFPRVAPSSAERTTSPTPHIPGAFGIPSADAHRARTTELRRDEPDSSDEEVERRQNVQVERHEGGGAGRLRRRRDSEPTPVRSDKKGGGLFSGLFGLFKTGKSKRDPDNDSLRDTRRSGSTPSWSTRTDTNLRGMGKLRRSDSSDEETRQFVKVVNTGNPQQRLRMGDEGPKPKIVHPPRSKRPATLRRSSVLTDPGRKKSDTATAGSLQRGGTVKQKPAANGSAVPAGANLSRSGTVKSTTSGGTVKRKKKKPKATQVLQSGGGDAPSIMSLVDEEKVEDVPPVPPLPALATNAAETASLLSVGSDTAPSRAYAEEDKLQTPTPVASPHGPGIPAHLVVPAHSALKGGSDGGSHSDSALSKRKSVRLAADAKASDAEYSNTAPPAAPEGAKKLTPPAAANAWATRTPRTVDSSDEEGEDGMSEYAKARKAMARADRHIKEAGTPEKAAQKRDKGKQKAANQDL